MLQINDEFITGFESALRGMRNPMQSHETSNATTIETNVTENHDGIHDTTLISKKLIVSDEDVNLARKLTMAGPDHRKFLRMITVYADITGPLYWWKEFDTYKVGTVANSESTMHTLHKQKITKEMFSHEHLNDNSERILDDIIIVMNTNRERYLKDPSAENKDAWWQMIQLMPASFNQKRTVMTNYEVLYRIYHSRAGHKLEEWEIFRRWCRWLPYFETICLGETDDDC